MSITGPVLIAADSFQNAWISAAKKLVTSGYRVQSLVASIKDPRLFDVTLHQQFYNFAEDNSLIKPKAVAYTIFPHKLYDRCGNADSLFDAYNKPNGLFQRLKRKRPRDWDTYFRRMTYYNAPDGPQNQLANIINSINSRGNIWKAAYVILIPEPGAETIRPRGGPCLNYIALQLNPDGRQLGALAVYRSHDFYERAYGNYWGLCNLIKFISQETGFTPSHLTCVSSYAFINGQTRLFKEFIETLV